MGGFCCEMGMGAILDPRASSREDYLVVGRAGRQDPESRILLAAPIGLEEIRDVASPETWCEDDVEWDPAARAVAARRRERLGAIVLQDVPLRNPDPVRVMERMLEAVRRGGVGRLPWNEGARRIRERMASFVGPGSRLAGCVRPRPDWSELEDWLAPRLDGIARWDQLERIDLGELAVDRLPDWEQRAALDRLAPTHVTSRAVRGSRVDYW